LVTFDTSWNQRIAITTASIHHRNQVFSIKKDHGVLLRRGTSSLRDLSGNTTKVGFPTNLSRYTLLSIEVIGIHISKGITMNRTSREEIPHFTVAIIGGGFAGATVAAQVLRNSSASVSVMLVERGARLGRGVAYGTSCLQHLLNVPAKNMSAFPDDPEHFLRWARLHHDIGVDPGDFLPRQVYGRYVAFVLQQEIELHPARFERVQDEAVSAARAGGVAEIHLRSGQILSADKVVLALGNFPPGDPRLPGRTQHSQRYVSDPWAPGALGDVSHGQDREKEQDILLVGSGLTSVDVAIALRAQGFGGTIHLLSRRGLLPQNHKGTAIWTPFWNQNSPKTIRELLRLIRTQVEAAQKLGSGWRGVIDSLRPFSAAIWRSLSLLERRRFLRHVRPYWEAHRHRVAPEIGVPLAIQIQNGQIETHAGRIEQYAEDADGVDVTYRDRKTGELKPLRVARVVNCTGPEVDCRRIENLLLNNLMAQKLVRPDPLCLGLDASGDGALIDARGKASDFLYTLGPSRKGSLWETTAVPEIRVQASQLATLLLTGSEQSDPEEKKTNQYEPAADVHSAA
jgi:uncharacterized NAD(P)/FAD-binding protein YdhS